MLVSLWASMKGQNIHQASVVFLMMLLFQSAPACVWRFHSLSLSFSPVLNVLIISLGAESVQRVLPFSSPFVCPFISCSVFRQLCPLQSHNLWFATVCRENCCCNLIRCIQISCCCVCVCVCDSTVSASSLAASFLSAAVLKEAERIRTR